MPDVLTQEDIDRTFDLMFAKTTVKPEYCAFCKRPATGWVIHDGLMYCPVCWIGRSTTPPEEE